MSYCAVPHVFREALPGDEAFVIHAWVEEMRTAPAAWGMPDSSYFPWQREYIRRQLREARTVVACATDDPTHLYGYITFTIPNYVHWCYVKSAFRQLGIARSLVAATLGDPPRILVTQASRGVLAHLREKREHARISYIAPQYLVRQEHAQ